MILSISNPRKGGGGGGYYFKYYAGKNLEKGCWHGEGAKQFGLEGDVKKKAFVNLIDGFSPDGNRKLVQNAGSKRRQNFWDLTFSCPKAVSVLYMAASPEVRKIIEDCVLTAAKAALSFQEQTAGLSRRGKAGKELEPAALTFAVFLQLTSRLNEPQIHVHCLLFNVGVRGDGTTGALYTENIFQQKMAAGEVSRAELARQLEDKLKLQIELEPIGFHIKGVPRELCEECSSRSKQIRTELDRAGKYDAKTAKRAALRTRGKKEDLNNERVFENWKKIADRHKWDEQAVEKLISGRSRQQNHKSKRENSEDRRHSSQNRKPRPSKHAANNFAFRNPFYPFYIYRKQIFPHAPRWSPARKIRLPVIAIHIQRQKRWGQILWRRKILTAGLKERELRVQERKLFRTAPGWSPLRNLSVPALRIVDKRSDFFRPYDRDDKYQARGR